MCRRLGDGCRRGGGAADPRRPWPPQRRACADLRPKSLCSKRQTAHLPRAKRALKRRALKRRAFNGAVTSLTGVKLQPSVSALLGQDKTPFWGLSPSR